MALKNSKLSDLALPPYWSLEDAKDGQSYLAKRGIKSKLVTEDTGPEHCLLYVREGDFKRAFDLVYERCEKEFKNYIRKSREDQR